MTRFFSGYFRVGRESVDIFQYLLICLATGCFAYTKGIAIFDLVSSSSFGEYYKVQTFPLTRALLGGGGGPKRPPPRTFPTIAQKRKGIELRNFLEPLPTSIIHILTKGKFHTYDRLAVSDVRVTSCFAILGQK